MVETTLQTFYDQVGIPYVMGTVNGHNQPVLDRRGWLHLVVSVIRAAPDDFHRVSPFLIHSQSHSH